MMALQQLWEKMFMNWNLSALERGNFRRVIVHGDHLMAEFRETCCGNQTDVSRANQSNAHHSSSAIGTPTKKPAAVQRDAIVSLKLRPNLSLRPVSFSPKSLDRAKTTIRPDTECPAPSIVRMRSNCGLALATSR